MENKNISFSERVKKFTPMHWILLVAQLAFMAAVLTMIIIWSRDFASGVPFITGPANSDGSVGEELIAYEVTVYVFFWIIFLVLIICFLYDLIWYPLDKIIIDKGNKTELLGGQVVPVNHSTEVPEKKEESSESKDLSKEIKEEDDESELEKRLRGDE